MAYLDPQKSKSRYSKVPELSLDRYINGDTESRRAFSDALWDGFKYYGFIILKDHGVKTEILRSAYAEATKLFALPVETKHRYAGIHGGQRGYTPFGKEHAKNNRYPDLKEFWHVGREIPAGHKYSADYPNNVWPQELTEFKNIFMSLYSEMDRVGQIMLRALTPYLEVSEDYFEKLAGEGNTILRLLHYPPIAEGTDPNCVRAAAHEDINLITLLVAASTSGLELLDRDGKWLAVEASADSIIVDAGDMLARITNDIIPATTHRVVNPKGPNVSRYSMPFFVHPNPDARLECLESCKGSGAKYPPIGAQEFLLKRLEEIGLTK